MRNNVDRRDHAICGPVIQRLPMRRLMMDLKERIDPATVSIKPPESVPAISKPVAVRAK